MKRRLLRCLKAADTVKVRRVQQGGHTYVVAPLIVMTEGVRHAVNSTGPELVPADVIEASAADWSGIPVVFRHPEKDGELVSVTTPGVQDFVVGFAAAGRWEDARLRVEAWIDVDLITKREGGAAALATIERGDHLDVSAGSFVEIEAKEGEFGGRQYVGVQRSIVPDHIALLSVGEAGACNWADGCGAARSWARPTAGKQLRASGGADCKCKHAPTPEAHEQQRAGWLAALKRLGLGLRSSGKLGHNAIREALQAAVIDAERPRDDEFVWVLDVFDDRVVYVRGQETWQREYTMTAKGVVKLSEDRVEVRPETQFVPVAAAGQEASKMKDRIDKLITAKRFVEADREWLAKLTDAQLGSIEKAAGATEPDPAKPAEPATPATPAADPAKAAAPSTTAATPVATPAATPAAAPAAQAAAAKPLTEAEFLATLPPNYRAAVERSLKADKAHRDTLVAKLVAHKANKISKERLEAMTVEQLEELAALAGETVPAPDFSGRGGPAPAAQAEGGAPPPAPRMATQMAKKPAADTKAA